MAWNGTHLRYADAPSFLDRLLDTEAPVKKVSVSTKQAQQVYQFKAAFHFNKSIWRRLELQGQHTLADFDHKLRAAFHHDSGDHLGGFWKLVRRGESRRFREVKLGTVLVVGKGRIQGWPAWT
jgi:hypothetical protein